MPYDRYAPYGAPQPGEHPAVMDLRSRLAQFGSSASPWQHEQMQAGPGNPNPASMAQFAAPTPNAPDNSFFTDPYHKPQAYQDRAQQASNQTDAQIQSRLSSALGGRPPNATDLMTGSPALRAITGGPMPGAAPMPPPRPLSPAAIQPRPLSVGQPPQSPMSSALGGSPYVSPAAKFGPQAAPDVFTPPPPPSIGAPRVRGVQTMQQIPAAKLQSGYYGNAQDRARFQAGHPGAVPPPPAPGIPGPAANNVLGVPLNPQELAEYQSHIGMKYPDGTPMHTQQSALSATLESRDNKGFQQVQADATRARTQNDIAQTALEGKRLSLQGNLAAAQLPGDPKANQSLVQSALSGNNLAGTVEPRPEYEDPAGLMKVNPQLSRVVDRENPDSPATPLEYLNKMRELALPGYDDPKSPIGKAILSFAREKWGNDQLGKITPPEIMDTAQFSESPFMRGLVNTMSLGHGLNVSPFGDPRKELAQKQAAADYLAKLQGVAPKKPKVVRTPFGQWMGYGK